MKKKWWHDKVAYQIYPKSFMDTNGDGIGDLRGIIEKLDYLKGLGIDIVWISPIYQSPFVDQGYDISDYYNIDPRFGTMADFDELLKEAKKRDMYIVMDLVVNHCSDQHEWFQKMLEDPEGPYADYFYIREGKDGQPPCNWRSYFGGSVWEPIPGTDKYYLHLFAKEQPDLNWENPALREAIYQMMNWWLDKGLAGFRIDAIINIKKDLTFSDMVPDRDDGMCSSSKMVEKVEGLDIFLNEMVERTFRPHDAFSIAELFGYQKEDLHRYIGDDGCFSSIFDFATDQINPTTTSWEKRMTISPSAYREAIYDSQQMAAGIGFMANIIENHDEPRGASRYLPVEGCHDRGKKMLATVTMMLRGLPFLYQGQEIGMTNNQFQNIEEVDDIGTKYEYEVLRGKGLSEAASMVLVNRYSRDHSRTPMHWDNSVNAGFTEGTPWLTVNVNHKEINVASQLEGEDSVFHYYRKLIALRKHPLYKEVIVNGDFDPVACEDDDLMVFLRKDEHHTLMIAASFSNSPRTLAYNGQIVEILINNAEESSIPLEWDLSKGITLEPFQGIVLSIE